MSETKIIAEVTQGELEEIAIHRREYSWHKKELERMERDAVHLLLAGAAVEDGRFVAKVTFRSQHSLSWKNVVVRELGEEFALQEWRNSRLIKIPRLSLTEHPYMPLWDKVG